MRLASSSFDIALPGSSALGFVGFGFGFGVDVALSRDPVTGERFQIGGDVRYLFTRRDEVWERRRRDGLLVTLGVKVRF